MKCQIKNCKTDAVAIERLMIYDDNSDFNALNLEPELVQIDILECLHHMQIRKGVSECVEFVQADLESSKPEDHKIEFKLEEKYVEIVRAFANVEHQGNINDFVKREFLMGLRALLESNTGELFKQELQQLELELFPAKEEVISQ